MGRHVQERLDREQPEGIPVVRGGERFGNGPRGAGVRAGPGEPYRAGEREAVRIDAADRIAPERGEGHRVVADSLERAAEGGLGFLLAALSCSQRADGVPRVRAALARIQVAGGFARQFALELGKSLFSVAAREVDQTAQPVQGDRAELRARQIRGEARGELPLCLVQGLAGDIHGRGEPVREREVGEERQRPVRCAQTRFAPGDVGQAEMMPPVVGLEGRRSIRRRDRVDAMDGAAEREAQGSPGFGPGRVEAARVAGVMNGAREGRRVGRGIGTRRLEAHQAGGREAHVRGCVLRHGGDRALEHLERARDLSGFERLERGAALDERPVRREQRIEAGVGLA